jgi:hypothetical protein
VKSEYHREDKRQVEGDDKIEGKSESDDNSDGGSEVHDEDQIEVKQRTNSEENGTSQWIPGILRLL